MLRKIFVDDILQMYSFVGQKKKKIFSSLGSCSIIIGNLFIYLFLFINSNGQSPVTVLIQTLSK